jgi:glycosyltransferase involved in cell wall biosynthesis
MNTTAVTLVNLFYIQNPTIHEGISTQKPTLISIIVCAHNEEKYIDKSIPNIIKTLEKFPNKIIVVADRCTDKTVEKAKKYPVEIIVKNWKNWKNSYSEALHTGYIHAKGTYVSIVDADIIVPSNFFKNLIPLLKGKTVSISAHVITYPDTLLNRLMNAWEKTRKFAPLGQTPRGAARIILKKALDEIGGFRDVPSPDTDIDVRFAKHGYKSTFTEKVKVYHIRHITLKTIINGQINSGRGRHALGISLMKTVGHALLRFRPLTVCGWLLEWQASKRISKQLSNNPSRRPSK